MNTQLLHELVQRSWQSTITFPEVVQALLKEGFESYHVDLVRGENRYYLPDGHSHVEAMPHPDFKAATRFSAKDVESAVRAIQAGRIDYQEFVERIMLAGCVYYITYLSGKKVAYLGREGDVHVEHFPSGK